MDKNNRQSLVQHQRPLAGVWWAIASVYAVFGCLSMIALHGVSNASPSLWPWVNLVGPALLQGAVFMSLAWSAWAMLEAMKTRWHTIEDAAISRDHAFQTHMTASTLVYVLWALTSLVMVFYQPLYMVALSIGWVGVDIGLRKIKRRLVLVLEGRV